MRQEDITLFLLFIRKYTLLTVVEKEKGQIEYIRKIP